MMSKNPGTEEIEKIKRLLNYWLVHNNEHIQENKRWLDKIKELGLSEISMDIEAVINNLKEANEYISSAIRKIEKPGVKIEKKSKKINKPHLDELETEIDKVQFTPIGIIHTPYKDNAPYQPVENDEGNFTVVLKPEFTEGLYKLERFKYIYVIYYLHKIEEKPKMHVLPPWSPGEKVGLFASRSPARPNNIGLSIVKLKRIEKNIIYTSGLDVFDGTPLLDIKPYVKDLDSKRDANYGWIESQEDWEHLILHIKGIPHKH